MVKLLVQTISKFILGLLLVGVLLFLPAGTLEFWNAWLFIGLLFIPMLFIAIILFVKNPKLLEKRIKGKETEKEQKLVILLSLIVFVAGFLISGFDFRYGWSNLPNIVVIIGSIILVISYILYAEVMRENTYLSRSIEIQ